MTAQDSISDLALRLDAAGLRLPAAAARRSSGRVKSIVGTVVRAELQGACMGELCELRDPTTGPVDVAEVVGIDGGDVVLAPYGGVAGLSCRIEVLRSHSAHRVAVGEHLLGAVLDGRGRIVRASAGAHRMRSATRLRDIAAAPPDPLERLAVRRAVPTGIRAIDGLLTVGEGQRIGIYGSPGTGKSTLIGSLIDNAQCDVAVVALVGERGREVTDFVDRHMSGAAAERTILVAATSDRPSLERLQAALVATTIAEHFRDEGKTVLLVVDSVTRLARAVREIGLAAGEPAVRRGFPPSVFTCLPRLFERAGPGARGAITAFYTVLVEGEIATDPIAEETRSLLDGHIVLSEALLSAGWYPAIDVLASRSRTMNATVEPSHRRAADRWRRLMDRRKNLEFLVKLGEYQRGRDAEDDVAQDLWPGIAEFLQQDHMTVSPFQTTVDALRRIAGEAP